MNKQDIEMAIGNIKYGLRYEDCGNMVVIRKFAAYQALSALEQQLNGGWIPVNERLPKEEGCYLVTLKHKESGNLHVDLLDYDKEMFCYRDNLQKWWWEVIAWRFIPEPYKELATDNNVVTKSGKDNNVLTIGDKMRECGEKLSKFIETITNTKDTALSPEEAQELKAERDYWEREAKKWCSKLGEIRELVERNGVNVIDQNTRAKRNKKRIFE